MIDCIEYKSNFSSVSNAANAKPGKICPGFEELLTEKAASRQAVRHGTVGDGQDLFPELNGMSTEVINALMSLTDDIENIWEIVLRLEKRVDIEVLSENIVKDLDNAAGRSSAAALLTRFWKKKALLANDASEVGVDISTCFSQNPIENKAASELEALILKDKERKFITPLNPGLSRISPN